MKKEEKKVEQFRVNISMSTEIVEFYQKMADSMGIPRSSCMIMGLKTFMDQQVMLEMSKKM